MVISLISSIDASTCRIKRDIIPLAIDLLEKDFFIDNASRKAVLSKLYGKGYYSSDENVVMLISYDPKTCAIPKEYCNGDCKNCFYNPITGLFDPYLPETPLVITSHKTIDVLLEIISFLIKAFKIALQRECTDVNLIFK
jgi:hypothetical protein